MVRIGRVVRSVGVRHLGQWDSSTAFEKCGPQALVFARFDQRIRAANDRRGGRVEYEGLLPDVTAAPNKLI